MPCLGFPKEGDIAPLPQMSGFDTYVIIQTQFIELLK